MPYEILATSKTPALIIYLLDVSGSMSEKLGQKRRIDVVMDALGAMLKQMVFRSTKGGRILPRYRVIPAAPSTHSLRRLHLAADGRGLKGGDTQE